MQMTMTKELEKRLRLMQRFNQVLGDKRRAGERVYNDKIFVHNGIMYATDGHILVVAANLTGQRGFSFFKCSGKKFEYLDSIAQEVKEVKEATRDGEEYERILEPLNCASVSFDIDFEGFKLPVNLCSRWSKRWEDKLTVNFQTEEAVIDFCGGLEGLGGVTGTYGDIIKNVSGTVPENPMKFALWNILEIMRQCKVSKVRIESCLDRNLNTCKVGDYTFLFTRCD